MYLTFDQYKSMGGTLEVTSYNNIERQARTKINAYCKGRTDKLDPVPTYLSDLTFDIIETLVTYTQNQAITSESVDGISISYADIKTTLEVNQTKINQLIYEQLFDKVENGERLIYAG